MNQIFCFAKQAFSISTFNVHNIFLVTGGTQELSRKLKMLKEVFTYITGIQKSRNVFRRM